jgi:hypothetical protein
MDVRTTALASANTLGDGAGLHATDVASRVRDWGFLAHPDLPDGPGPAFLLVALRSAPTLQHFDPEAVDYWVTEGGRGERRTLTYASPMPRTEDFAWGLIRLIDRLGISNEYLTFGGHLDAASVDHVVVVAFASPAPLLRRGGHSQAIDPGSDAVGAFFGRLMVGVDDKPGFEAAFAGADPIVRYAAFIRDGLDRRRSRGAAAPEEDELDHLFRGEGARLRAAEAERWKAAGVLLATASAD